MDSLPKSNKWGAGIVGWWCPTELRLVPLDHFIKNPTHGQVPVALINKMLRDTNAPEQSGYHVEPQCSPSIGMGCPREILQERFIGICTDPRSKNSAYIGKAVHKLLEGCDNGDWYHEFPILPPNKEWFDIYTEIATRGAGRDDIRIALAMKIKPPVLFGVPMYGTIDRVAKDLSVIEDYKTMGERQYRYHHDKEKGIARAEAAAQMNLYRMMLKQTFGVEVETMRAWYGAQVAAGFPPWDPCDVPVMSEDDILAIRPGGGEYTFGQNLKVISVAFEMIKEWLEKRKLMGGIDKLALIREFKEFVVGLIKQIPLMGDKMYGEQKCYKYCSDPRLCAKIGYWVGETKYEPRKGPGPKQTKAWKTRKPKTWLDNKMTKKPGKLNA